MFHFASNLLLSLAGSFVRSIFSKKKYLERDHVKLESSFSVRIWKVRKDNLVLGIFRMTHKPLNESNVDVTLCTELLMNASNTELLLNKLSLKGSVQ
jgi:hypothetical protein